MRHDSRNVLLPDPVADGNGPAQDCKDLIDKMIQLQGGTYDFSVALEFSIDDGGTWHVLVSATATAITPTDFPQAATDVRTVVSSFVSVTDSPVITLVGRDATVAP